MSRIGKKQISIPEKVNISQKDDVISVSGPLGELKRIFKDSIEIKIQDKIISLEPKFKSKEMSALWGTYASHIINMISGVTNGFSKKLLIEGVGFKAQVEGQNLILNLGLSHPIKKEIPKDIKVLVEKNLITISGADKEKIGQFSAEVRAFKKPEPYKGKGIRYENEVVRKKSGKKAATAA